MVSIVTLTVLVIHEFFDIFNTVLKVSFAVNSYVFILFVGVNIPLEEAGIFVDKVSPLV